MHLLRTAVDIYGVGVIAAVIGAALVGLTRHDVAVAAVIWIAPLPGDTGISALQGLELRFAGQLPVTLIHRAADLAADEAADHRTCDSRNGVAFAFAKLIADNAAARAAISINDKRNERMRNPYSSTALGARRTRMHPFGALASAGLCTPQGAIPL